MRHNFEERRQNRIQYAQKNALKKQQLAEQLERNAKEMASFIPFGQPILIGHHSEQSDRRYRQRIHDTFGKAYAAQEQAAHHEAKAETIANNSAIFSDDPKALDKLRDKLSAIEAAQAYMKAANKCIRKGDKAGFLALPISTEEFWIQVTTPDPMGRTGFPSYAFQNNSAEMRRIKGRIKQLELLSQRKSSEEVINGVRLRENVEANRIQILFPGIPSEEVRKKLRTNGFRWCPSEGAWQRHITSWAHRVAKVILNATQEFVS